MQTTSLKSIFAAAMVAASLLTFSACNSGKKDEHAGHDHSSEEMSASAKPTFNDPKVESAYQHYIHVKEALVATNAEEAKNGANALKAALTGVAGGEKAAEHAGKIAEASDVEVQRTAFFDLSSEMLTLVKNGSLASGEIYKEYCPMAFDNTGAFWLSSEKEIKNPYFGDKMLSCGEVQETITKQ